MCWRPNSLYNRVQADEKAYSGKLKSIDLSGKYCFAFDTKFDSRMSGCAAKFIEKQLNSLGLKIITPRESAIVFGIKEKEGGARLREGEEKRFKQIGLQIGTAKVQYRIQDIVRGDRC